MQRSDDIGALGPPVTVLASLSNNRAAIHGASHGCCTVGKHRAGL
ncbi:MAG: hypothetical protein ABW168_19960 [Sedimenticola sp.]